MPEQDKTALNQFIEPLMEGDIKRFVTRASLLGAKAGVISWFPRPDGDGFCVLTNFNDASGKPNA